MSSFEVSFPLDDAPVYVISVAAQLAGLHPQTLRQYDRLGLVSPGRAVGRGRRYSARDVAALREVQRLSQEEGINLAGIKRIMDLENSNMVLRARLVELQEDLRVNQAIVQRLNASQSRVFAASTGGDIVAMAPGRRPSPSAERTALMPWRPPISQRTR